MQNNWLWEDLGMAGITQNLLAVNYILSFGFNSNSNFFQIVFICANKNL